MSSAALTISMPAALSTACLSPTRAVHSKQPKPKPCTPHPALLRQERVKEVINQQMVDISTVSKLSAPLMMRGGEKHRPRTSILSGQFCQALRVDLLAGLYMLVCSLKQLSLDGFGFLASAPVPELPVCFQVLQTQGKVYRGSSYSTTSPQMFMPGAYSRAPPRLSGSGGQCQEQVISHGLRRTLGRQQGGQQLGGNITSYIVQLVKKL